MKKVGLPYAATLKTLRRKICELYDLSSSEFELSTSRYIYGEDHDDAIRSLGWDEEYMFKRKHSFKSKNHPKHQLSENEYFFERMFELLSQEHDAVTDDTHIGVDTVWRLLMKLPLNKKLQHQIKTIELGEEGWKPFLDGQSPHKMLYSLNIVKDLMQDEEWKLSFMQHEGIEHLYKEVCGMEMENIITSSLSFSCIKLLFNILNSFLTTYENLAEKVSNLKGDFIRRLLSLCYGIVKYQKQVEDK